MPKRKRPEEDPKEQFKKFVDAAKEHGVDAEDEKRIEDKFKALSRAQRKLKQK